MLIEHIADHLILLIYSLSSFINVLVWLCSALLHAHYLLHFSLLDLLLQALFALTRAAFEAFQFLLGLIIVSLNFLQLLLQVIGLGKELSDLPVLIVDKLTVLGGIRDLCLERGDLGLQVVALVEEI